MSTMPEEIDLMDGVDVVPWGTTEPDEIAILDRLLLADPGSGTYSFRVGSLAPNTVAAALNEANKWIGVSGRPNVFTREYAKRHGDDFLRVAWCDMFQTYISRHAPAPAVTPHGDRAYTPWHAYDFQQVDQAYPGTLVNVTAHAAPGTVIFFDWGGTNMAPNTDHVGMTLKNLGGGRILTIEGNTGDKVAIKARASDVISMIGVPAYVREPRPAPPTTVGDTWPYKAGTIMRKGWLKSRGVARVQERINALGYRPVLIADGDFGTKTENGVRWAQRRFKIEEDGLVGKITWGKLFS